MIDYAGWKRGIGSGVVAGIAWGLLSLAIHAFTGISPVEHGILYNIFPFTTGGVIFGIFSGGILALIHDRLPFKTSFIKAVLLTTWIWLILHVGGFLLSLIDVGRYHYSSREAVHGLMLAVLLGGILGVVWQVRNRGWRV
ncbi:MAG TPA: hypothetical protein ACFYD0_15150 [Candidatus Wunengus sp. YC65]|uniref:hypothetical protein n=1 Tax=Candidatus Wunengus sp. YC65 TaxID=3367701 RepID=UPI00402710F9